MNNFYIDRNNGFVCYDVSQSEYAQMLREYTIQYGHSAVLNRQTDTDNPESRKAGILGEIVFGKYLGNRAVRSKPEDITYDFVYKSFSGDLLKIDVKCKLRGVTPKSYFEASTYAYQLTSHFDCDYYVFLSTTSSFKYVWLCAFCSKEAWACHPNGTYWRVGDVDPSNHKVFTKDTWSVRYCDLNYLKVNGMFP